MASRLEQGLAASITELEAGLGEAEAELARSRQRARELEELIALGKATLLAARMSAGNADLTNVPAPAAPSASPDRSGTPAAAKKASADLASRLDKAYQT